MSVLQLDSEKLLNGSVECGGNHLRLIAHAQVGKILVFLLLFVLQRQHFDKSRFPCAILSQQDYNLRIAEMPGFDCQRELSLGLLHLWIGILPDIFVLEFLQVVCDLEIELIIPESHVFSRNEAGQKDIYAFSHRKRHCYDAVSSLLTV